MTHDLLLTRDCLEYGCTNDAGPDGTCAEHVMYRRERSARLARQAVVLRRQGKLAREVAEELGITRGHAAELYTDPTGAKAKARKDGYRKPCPKCGRLMCGQDGPRSHKAPKQCRQCQTEELKAEKYWTRERVIDAIQRFAKRHGRPPTADEWLRSDQAFGYPPRSAVYTSTSRSTAPFRTWADAIEASGFPRPTSGRRLLPKGVPMSYVVMQEVEEGLWRIAGEHDSHSQIIALNAALNGHEPKGRWVAIPGRYFQPRSLRQKMVYDWEDSEAVAEASPA